MKTLLLAIITILCSHTLSAKGKLGIVDDGDGYTYVRSGPGEAFTIIDTLFNNDFLYFESTDSSEWLELSPWKGSQTVGFVHETSIQDVEQLESTNLKALITKTLNRQKDLADSCNTAWNSRDSLTYMNTYKTLELHSDTRYDPILNILSKYFCSTSDTEVLQLFFASIWADKGSANEMPSFSIGNCFACKPDLVIEQLQKIKDIEQKKLLFDQIEWGLLNNFSVDENGKSDNKEFNNLKARLDNERKKASQ